jgi:hypothetical protein
VDRTWRHRSASLEVFKTLQHTSARAASFFYLSRSGQLRNLAPEHESPTVLLDTADVLGRVVRGVSSHYFDSRLPIVFDPIARV